MSKNIPNFAVHLKISRPARRLTFPVGMTSCGKFLMLFNTKNRTKVCVIRKIVLSLQCHKQVLMARDHLNAEELELIEAIRNLRRAYPNGYDELLWYAQQLFDKLVEMPPADE